jgi:hypothetical protein
VVRPLVRLSTGEHKAGAPGSVEEQHSEPACLLILPSGSLFGHNAPLRGGGNGLPRAASASRAPLVNQARRSNVPWNVVREQETAPLD